MGAARVDANPLLWVARLCALPPYRLEYRFAAPDRQWRVDAAFVSQKLAIEVEGGVWTQGRHTRASGFLKDMEKYNELAARGWRLLRFTPAELARDGDPLRCGELILRALAAAVVTDMPQEAI